MIKVKLRPTIQHGKGCWIVPYLIPSWCSSCPPDRKELLIKSENKPTLEYIKEKIEQLDYEVED